MTKQRLSVPLSQTLYKEIQKKSEQMGITMSSYVAFIISNHLQNEIRITEALAKQVGLSMEDVMKSNLIAQKENSKEGE